ncbi:MAG: hypothetical protein AB7P07_13860 [Hyphomonadaceae bacterium]
MKQAWVGLLLLLAACASAPAAPPANALNAAAEDYVHLALGVGAREEGYIDAYFGPPEWRDVRAARAPTTSELRAEADALIARLQALPAAQDEASRRRIAYLIAAAESTRFRIDMIDGVRVPFAEEAERLFALRPELLPLTHYDAVLARIDALVPGAAPLAERVENLRAQFYVPADRVQAVMDAAIAACRERTAAHLDLPANENFSMEYVRGQSWSAYNWYQGDNQSLIQVNLDLPLAIDRALDLGCHEGYPGHHVQGIYNERKYRENGWVEFSVAPLYAPASPLNEGGGNAGLALAFPEAERLAFEVRTLYPLAGLDPARAAEYDALLTALDDLAGARLTIAALYLDGEITRERAIELSQHYQLVTPQRAAQLMAFNDQYRSYVINYVSGEALVRDYVERAGADPAARWAAFERYLSLPMLPQDLAP